MSSVRKMQALILAQQKIMEVHARAVSKLHSKSGEYEIHDNYGRPYTVHVMYDIRSDKYKVLVHRNSHGDFNNPGIIQILIHTYEASDVFIGESPLNKMTTFSGYRGPEFDGNSILIHVQNLPGTCIFIGQKIFSFVPYAPIVEFVSPVGNNDVPYPYAIDKEGRYYLMIESVVIQNLPSEARNDPYEYYYSSGKYDILKQRFEGNINAYVGKTPIDLRYKVDALEHFDRCISDYYSEDSGSEDHPDDTARERGHLYVRKESGEVQELTRNDYIALMQRFRDHAGLREFLNMHIIEHRMW